MAFLITPSFLLTDYAKRMPGASESHLSYPILEDLGHGDEITEVISLLNQHPLDFTPVKKAFTQQ